MPITGGAKIFTNNKGLFADGTTIAASSGDASAEFAIDRNRISYWRSVGSDDTTQETLTITFPSAVTIDRIHLVDHNFKLFDIQYDNSGFTDFTNVVGLDGALGGGISETTFADNTAYYEFDSVSTTIIRIRCTETQTTDAQKYLNQAVFTEELGTLQGFPIISIENSRNQRQDTSVNNRSIVTKSSESFPSIAIDFETYPTGTTYNPDWDLMYTVFDREEDFIFWASGGKRGASSFKFAHRGFRLQDIITCQIIDSFIPEYLNNVYVNPISMTVNMAEVA